MKTKLFRKGAFRHGTILLNWHGDPAREYRFFAEAFHLLGKKGARALKRRRHFPSSGLDDFHACPIVFLYRHALELYVKVILFAAPGGREPRARCDQAVLGGERGHLDRFVRCTVRSEDARLADGRRSRGNARHRGGSRPAVALAAAGRSHLGGAVDQRGEAGNPRLECWPAV